MSEAEPEENGIYESIEDTHDDGTGKQRKKSAKKARTAKDLEVRDAFQYKVGIAQELKPISKNSEIFADMTKRALELGLDPVLKHFNGRKLKVATMCSGTESPLLALGLVSEGEMIFPSLKLRC